MAAGRLERARGVLQELEAALALEPEDGDVPTRLLVEHAVDSRRKLKLLLTQLRVLQLLLGLIRDPQTPPGPPQNGGSPRRRWRGLKSGYEGALRSLGGSLLPPALAQIQGGHQLLQRWGGVLGAQQRKQEQLEAALGQTRGRLEELRQRVARCRQERLGHQGALRLQGGGAESAAAGCRLYQTLTGEGSWGGVEAPPLPHPPPAGTPPPSP